MVWLMILLRLMNDTRGRAKTITTVQKDGYNYHQDHHRVMDHKQSANNLIKRKVDRVLRPENVIFNYFSKSKGSAAYNQ